MTLNALIRQPELRSLPSVDIAHLSEFKRYQWNLRPVITVVDALTVSLALLIAALVRDTLAVFPDDQVMFDNAERFAPAFVLLWVAMLWLFRSYSERSMGAGSGEYQRVLVASTTAAGLVGVTVFLTDYPLDRGYFVEAITLGSVLLLLERLVIRRILHRLRLNGRLVHRVLLVGAPQHVDSIARVLGREKWLGFRVVGAVLPPQHQTEHTPLGAHHTPLGVPVLASTTDLLSGVDRHAPSAVIFVGGLSMSQSEVRSFIWELGARGIGTFLVPGITDIAGARVRMEPLGGVPIVHVAPPYAEKASHAPKRLFDLAVSGALLVMFAPLLAVVALIIRAGDGGTVSYHQTRVGRDGKLFRIHKFRTMVPNADELAQRMREQYNDPGAVLFKMTDDPRVTRAGHFLRHYSIDELPQLWNVFRGEMSLVGPRPALPHEVDLMTKEERLRLTVRPGLSGLWQVSGRSNLSREDARRLDIYYVENWSMLQDLTILARTARAVLRPNGAY